MKQKITQFVEHLRSKDEETRKHIATGTMIVVGAVLVLAWIATLDTTKPAQAEKKPLITEEEVRPFQMMKANFHSSFNTVSLGLGSLVDGFKNRKNADEAMTAETSADTTAGSTATMSPAEESAVPVTTDSGASMTNE